MTSLAQSPPVPIEPIVVIFVVTMPFSGVPLLGRGLWALATGDRRQGHAHRTSVFWDLSGAWSTSDAGTK
jgi:hypothetical protein